MVSPTHFQVLTKLKAYWKTIFLMKLLTKIIVGNVTRFGFRERHKVSVQLKDGKELSIKLELSQLDYSKQSEKIYKKFNMLAFNLKQCSFLPTRVLSIKWHETLVGTSQKTCLKNLVSLIFYECTLFLQQKLMIMTFKIGTCGLNMKVKGALYEHFWWATNPAIIFLNTSIMTIEL